MRLVEGRLGHEKLVAALGIGTGSDLARGQAVELVVGDLRCRGCGRVPQRERITPVVEDGITADHEVRAGIEAAFLPVIYNLVILRVRTLLNHVVSDYGVAAIREIDAEACGAVQIVDARISNGGGERAAFYLVTDTGVVEIAIVDRQAGELAGIEIVRLTVAVAVICKFAVIDRQSTE